MTNVIYKNNNGETTDYIPGVECTSEELYNELFGEGQVYVAWECVELVTFNGADEEIVAAWFYDGTVKAA